MVTNILALNRDFPRVILHEGKEYLELEVMELAAEQGWFKIQMIIANSRQHNRTSKLIIRIDRDIAKLTINFSDEQENISHIHYIRKCSHTTPYGGRAKRGLSRPKTAV